MSGRITKAQRATLDKRSARRRASRLRWLRRLYADSTSNTGAANFPRSTLEAELCIMNGGHFSSAATSVRNGDIFFSYGPLEAATATQLRRTLLHEMCHVRAYAASPAEDSHGPRWRAEMERVCPEQLAPFDAVLKELAMSS